MYIKIPEEARPIGAYKIQVTPGKVYAVKKILSGNNALGEDNLINFIGDSGTEVSIWQSGDRMLGNPPVKPEILTAHNINK